MKLGLLSDTHDNLPKIDKAVRFFNRHKTELVLHAGDFVAPFTIDRLDRLACEWLGVFGNNDGEKKGLHRKSEGRIRRPPRKLTLDGKKIILVHDLTAVDLKKECVDIIIFGHTHKPEIRRRQGILLVNPGECGGWLTGTSTIALVDLACPAAQIITI